MNLNIDSCSKNETIPWNEIIKRNVSSDIKWIVIYDNVYDITNFYKKHPGGSKVICSYAGHDATEVWTAMHPDKTLVTKYLKPLLIGRVEQQPKDSESYIVQKDFQELRALAESKGWFQCSPLFYLLHLLQIHFLEASALLLLWICGVHWWSFIGAALLLATAQAEAGWVQHDYGHLSVFNTRKLNHIAHEYVVGHLKGASSHWWNFRHNLHHSKPNTVSYDPDITLPYLLLLGTKMPIEWGKRHKGFMPYNWQQHYFFLTMPPLLLPFYFHYENIYFILKRKNIRDFIWTMTFFFKFYFLFNHVLSHWFYTFCLYMLTRFLESHWFTMVTQMSHIPMEVSRDRQESWLPLQLGATCNVFSSPFNDWFTGHLNFQIEHHLFPGMPRHNYHLVQPYVRELCKKHNLDYQEKPLLTAFVDIYRSLKKSGELWLDAYTNPG